MGKPNRVSLGKGKRVLFLGQTGVAKQEALARLAKYCHEKFYKTCQVIDFDKDCLFKRKNQTNFLDDDIHDQRREWGAAWDECFSNQISPSMAGDDDVFLGIHGCYTRSQYGSRCVLDLQRVAKFQPTLIVTLIDDVYDMWWRTEKRARGEAWRGRPTPEHLIGGRRAEVIAADLVALQCSGDRRIKNLVIAASHPCDTLAKCIYSEKLKVVYLSFPISEPRRMLARNDKTGIEAVSRFITQAHAKQKGSSDLAFTCPLAIDELPFSTALGQLQTNTAEFNRDALRWNLSDFWPPDERMALPADPFGEFITKDVRNAAGSIWTDVGWRDFRLAEQADALAVFNPIFPGRDTVTGGVAVEVAFAVRFSHPIYVYQDPTLDPNDLCAVWLKSYGVESGTMGQGPSGQLINRKTSLDDLFNSL